MKQKMYDGGEQGRENADTTGDGVLKDLAARNKELLAATEVKGDPRRREIIEVRSEGYKHFLYINGEMWSEVQWVPKQMKWCIQDRCGYCYNHLEHVHAEVPNEGLVVPRAGGGFDGLNPGPAIEMAKGMIRNGEIPSPEEAMAEFKKRTGHDYTNR